MSTEIRWRRGTTAEHATFTGAPSEVTVDTDKNTLVVHDGATPGGFPVATGSDVSDFMDKTTYDPQAIGDDVFDLGTHTGSLPQSQVTDLVTDLAKTDTHSLTEKTTPVDADEIRLADSAASYIFKRLTFASLKAWIKSWIGQRLIQEVISATGAVATGTTVIPDDDTIPQNTEGTEFLSLSITPTDASNILEIETQLIVSLNSGASRTTALFKSGTADALAVCPGVPAAASYIEPTYIKYRMVAGTTSPITFSVRAGPGAGATLTVNGASGARRFGGTMNSYIRIKEYTP